MRLVLLIACLVLVPALAASQTPSASPPPPPAGCTSAESHQFDFWVGRWTVSPTNAPERHVADSLIEKLYGGCAIRENWMPLGASGGGSLSSYVPRDKTWRQTWVDSSGSTVDFKGGWTGKAMVLTGVWAVPGHDKRMTEMTYAKAADGSVRQSGRTSDDGGKTWQPSFDLTYRPAKA
ncbi:hypothetical protein BH11PSE2_BH11PSE2_04380 [soil metagenome]